MVPPGGTPCVVSMFSQIGGRGVSETVEIAQGGEVPNIQLLGFTAGAATMLQLSGCALSELQFYYNCPVGQHQHNMRLFYRHI